MGNFAQGNDLQRPPALVCLRHIAKQLGRHERIQRPHKDEGVFSPNQYPQFDMCSLSFSHTKSPNECGTGRDPSGSKHTRARTHVTRAQDQARARGLSQTQTAKQWSGWSYCLSLCSSFSLANWAPGPCFIISALRY